mgnify:CR=1 FL=1
MLTLNRPDRLNAAPPALFDELRDALTRLDGARAVLLAGAGRAFCSGADVGGGALGADDPGEATYAALTDQYNPTMQAIADPPAYGRARAAVRYDEIARTLTAIGLDLKAVIDQFREQVQNLE